LVCGAHPIAVDKPATWTWTALEADPKLIASYMVGGRDAEYLAELMHDLRLRLHNRVQLTADGHSLYLQAVEGAFSVDVDFAQLVKIYGEPARKKQERRYSQVNAAA